MWTDYSVYKGLYRISIWPFVSHAGNNITQSQTDKIQQKENTSLYSIDGFESFFFVQTDNIHILTFLDC